VALPNTSELDFYGQVGGQADIITPDTLYIQSGEGIQFTTNNGAKTAVWLYDGSTVIGAYGSPEVEYKATVRGNTYLDGTVFVNGPIHMNMDSLSTTWE